jgi:biopolymer transport protein TolR
MAIDLGSSNAKPGRAQPTMNVTPLVDVVLVLLIIFMMVAPLLAKQFWLHLPNTVEKAAPVAPNEHDETVVVTVTKDGSILINRDKVEAEEFSQKLHRILAATRQRTIFFDADDDAEFGAAVSAMDLARGGGADTIAVVTRPLAR